MVRLDEVVGLHPGDAKPLGLALDLGRTRIATYLVDLTTGRTLASGGVMNSQIPYGEDVITRVTLAEKNETQGSLLHGLVVQELSKIASEMCAAVQAQPEYIVDAVIAGFVCVDHVAMLLATVIVSSVRPAMAIDIGSNSEICLFDDRQLTSASCASGPAFEGAHIKHGMRAADGTIERLRLTEGRLDYQAIGAGRRRACANRGPWMLWPSSGSPACWMNRGGCAITPAFARRRASTSSC